MHDVRPRQVVTLVLTIVALMALLITVHYMSGGSALATDIEHLVETGLTK